MSPRRRGPSGSGSVDLRSDTVTKPTDEMRRAMAAAEVGDDWYGDDPTVNRLEERAAGVMGKEDAVYLPTGTMANQIALHVFVRGGHGVACEATAHVATTEVASSAVVSGVSFVRLAGRRGRLSTDQVAEALEPDPYGVEVVDLLALENSHQVGGGTVMAVDDMRGIRKVANEAGVPLYLDGARLFNASAASGTPVADYAEQADALMFSLSKGLGAPIGSVLCGRADFIDEARRVKILLGAAWRQAGILAAAGLIALERGPEQLPRDHELARRLAEGLAEVTPAALDPLAVETNIVFVDTAVLGMSPFRAVDALAREGILANVVAGMVRLVTHRDVTPAQIDQTIAAWRNVASTLEPAAGP